MPSSYESARLWFRAVEPSDVDFLHDINNDPIGYANANYSITKPISRKSAESRVTFLSEKALLGVIIWLKNGQPAPSGCKVGQINLTPITAHHRCSSIGIDIISDYQRKGYGTEAISWVLEWGFQTAGLHRIELTVWGYNEGARRLYERLGFVEEGRKREALWHDGRWWDIIIMGILEGEWRARRSVDGLGLKERMIIPTER